jgi:prespore-specific regulator
MKTMRQDAWTTEDDNLLADIILHHIRSGSTQLIAFEEVGQRLGRTKAACGYRWNAIVRKEFTAQIEIAKAERRTNQSTRLREETVAGQGVHEASGEEGGERAQVGWGEVLRFLRGQRAESQALHSRLRQLERDLEVHVAEVDRLTKENQGLQSDLGRVEQELCVVKEDYVALVQIMERARKLAFLADGDDVEKPKFKMDENGNLERIE